LFHLVLTAEQRAVRCGAPPGVVPPGLARACPETARHPDNVSSLTIIVMFVLSVPVAFFTAWAFALWAAVPFLTRALRWRMARSSGICVILLSQHGAARSYLKGGDAPAVEHYEPVAMPTAQCAVVLREGGDDAVHGLVQLVSGLVVGNIQVLAADETDAQHELRHSYAP
jgi:hypothetical protein